MGMKIAKMGSSNRHCSISLAVVFVLAVLLLNADLGWYNFSMQHGCLDDQLASFNRVLARIAPGDAATKSLLSESLVVFGEIGGNDYNFWFFDHTRSRKRPTTQALGLPLPPSLPDEKTSQFPTGANFALFGATALNPNFFKRYNFGVPFPWSLDDQLASFKKVLARIAPGDAATKSVLSESLIVFGEIGGNDYNFWFFGGNGDDTDTPQKYMPDVIARIGDGVQEVIKLGAKTVLVPGNFPIGCVPAYLSGNKSNKSADYDQFHCLKRFNKFSQMHNQLLKQEVEKLKSLNADVKIIYADYYGAFMELVKNPSMNGIDDPLVACCGGNGPYGTGHGCNQTARVCSDPSRFASWDQIHMTEKAYNIIANGVLNGPYADTPLLHVC
ncbi:hypothetical protein ZWY2020_000700 [Hordeum vulgare]|nr:hypothetical protein ZWY2020_000700 [Hordeum vulgare]